MYNTEKATQLIRKIIPIIILVFYACEKLSTYILSYLLFKKHI